MPGTHGLCLTGALARPVQALGYTVYFLSLQRTYPLFRLPGLQMLLDVLSLLLKGHPLNLATDLISDLSHGLYSIKLFLILHRIPPPGDYGSLIEDSRGTG